MWKTASPERRGGCEADGEVNLERRGGCEAVGEVNSERRGANRKIDGEVTLRRRDTVGTRRAVTALTVHIVGYGVPDIPQFYVTCP